MLRDVCGGTLVKENRVEGAHVEGHHHRKRDRGEAVALGSRGPAPYDHEPFPSTAPTSCDLTADPVRDVEACGGAGCPGDGNSYYYLVAAECAVESQEGPYGYGEQAPPARDREIPASSTPCP